MKSSALTAVMIAISLLGTAPVKASAAYPVEPAPANRHLSHRQAKRLLNTASTPEEHRELAQYFREEAQRKRDKEQYYRELAATYRLHPPRVDAYRNESVEAHYDRLANEARNEADADEQLAVFHDMLAKGFSAAK